MEKRDMGRWATNGMRDSQDQSSIRGLWLLRLTKSGDRASGADLILNPRVGLLEPGGQRRRRRPPQLLPDQPVIGIPAAHSQWAVDVAYGELLAGYFSDHFSQLIDAHHLV